PRPTAQIAILLGFLEGTWAMLNGALCALTGSGLLNVPGMPWAAWGVGAALLGAAWMIAGNFYLFQNRPANWRALIVLIVVSSFGAGWAAPVLVAQLVLLLLPATRRGWATS
ncbi:MAG: hypothetical protein ACRD2D_13470, partial [Terriglobales bacterium]